MIEMMKISRPSLHFNSTVSVYWMQTCVDIIIHILPIPYYTSGWGYNVKSWPIISAIAKFTAFGPTFAIKIVSEPQQKFSRPMEKEIAQSNLPSKRKVPNTIRKYIPYSQKVAFLNKTDKRKIPLLRWVAAASRTHPPQKGEPTPHGGWAPVHGVQSPISPQLKTNVLPPAASCRF